MVAYGGAGPLHAVGVAQRLGAPCVVFPPSAGVLSALGLLTAPLGFESTASFPVHLDDLDIDATNALLARLEDHGRQLLAHAGGEEVHCRRSVDMCYVDQRYEVTTPIVSTCLGPSARSELKNRFDEAYEEAYGRRLDTLPARCITWRVLCTGPIPPLRWQEAFVRDGDSASQVSAPGATRRVVFPDQGAATTAIFARSGLGAGTVLAGPALIEDMASTIVIPPGATGHVDRWRNVIVQLQG
jgi:N-methylhydantoinase A